MSNRIMQSSVVALAIMALAGTAGAQTQTVNFSVAQINQIDVSGTVTLNITTATAGSDPTQAVDNTSGKWAVTTNLTGAKISASIDSDMPSGLTLKVNLAAPTGGTSAGAAALTAAGVDLVTGLQPIAKSGLGMTYTLDATATAAPVASGTRTVTYTISGGA